MNEPVPPETGDTVTAMPCQGERTRYQDDFLCEFEGKITMKGMDPGGRMMYAVKDEFGVIFKCYAYQLKKKAEPK